MNQKLLPQECEFRPESFEEMTKRYSGFGENLFEKLLSDEPEIVGQIKFYKRIDFQLEDSYAVISNLNTSIAIQLDPSSEVIILWNNEIQVEKGHWTENLLDETVDSIKTLLRQQNKT